ncbi:MAG: hypothetical protein K2J67_02030 [Lachnospiraceae bacterium]|nr:hypothetical protein [Lachnospiraceae bacterium]
MKQIKKLYFLLFVSLLLFTVAEPGAVLAASGKAVTKEVEYYTNNSSDKIDDQFPELIQENGQMYRLQDVRYETVSEKKETIAEPVTKSVRSKVLKQSDVYDPAQTMEEDGIVYYLQESTSEVVTQKKGKTSQLNGYTDYFSKSQADSAPAVKKITASDPDTGEEYTGNASKIAVDKRTQWENSYIDVHFTGYDSERYQWNGIMVEKNKKNPLKGYKKELLQSVGVTAEQMKNYKVGQISWTGKAYRNEKGILCRDARATIRRKRNVYRVMYQGIYSQEDTMGVVYQATYAGIRNRETGVTNYQMKAVAEYQLEDLKEIPFTTITIGILLFIVAFVGIIHLVYTRVKERRKNDAVR